MASITCGNCRRTHDSVHSVKTCHETTHEVDLKEFEKFLVGMGILDEEIIGTAAHEKPEEFTRVYLNVPYKDKNEAKSCGARWDAEKRSWWVSEANFKKYSLIFNKWGGDKDEQGMVQSKVPAGHYAIMDVYKKWHFFKISHGKVGSIWEGNTFIQRQSGSDYRRMDDAGERQLALQAIADNPREAAINYGKQLGRCSICNRELTDADSIAAGIGPVCAEKVGWK